MSTASPAVVARMPVDPDTGPEADGKGASGGSADGTTREPSAGGEAREPKTDDAKASAPSEAPLREGAIDVRQVRTRGDRAVRVSIVGLFVIALLAALQAAQTVLVPFTLALLLFLTFRPIVRWCARHHVPSALAAAVIVIGLVVAVGGVFYTLSGPVTRAAENAPAIAADVQQRLEGIRSRVESMVRPMGNAPEATGGEPMAAPLDVEGGAVVDTDGDREPEVVVRTDDGGGDPVAVVQTVAVNVAGILTTMLITLVLLFFLLASGSLFYEKLVQSFDRLEDKKQALFTVHQVERDISRYLLTITVINWGLGCAIGAAMWWLGMPNPLLWLVLAAVLNYLPYVGAIVGTVSAFVVALLTFPTIGEAALVPVVYYALTTFEGSVVTPYFVGRRLQINTVSVFLAVAIAAWLWGVYGALMAVPILVVVKEICENVPGGEGIAKFLSARPDVPPSSTSGGVPDGSAKA